MTELPATIKNEQGIHCRPSAVIVAAVRNFDGEIRVLADGVECDPKSVMALLSLGLHRGAPIKVRVSGPGEEEFCQRMVELFETEFDFPARQDGQPATQVEGGAV